MAAAARSSHEGIAGWPDSTSETGPTQVIVEHDGAAQLLGDAEPEERRELVLRADREGVERAQLAARLDGIGLELQLLPDGEAAVAP